jgi:hypothetical protein
MAKVKQRIEWIDEPIIIETDTDGNYRGVLVKNIDRLLAWHRGENIKITYYVERILPPVDHAWINEALDLMIVVKEMDADSFQTTLVVSAYADVSAAKIEVENTGPIEKTFYITFRKPRDKK